MVLSCQNICKSFGTDEIIKNASFNLENVEKAAIVGINGAGKSTLLKIIMGDLPADSGQVIIAKDKTIGFLSQHQDFKEDNTIYEEILEVQKPLIDLENQIRNLEKEITILKGEELEIALERYARLNHDFELKNGYAYKSETTGVLKGLGFKEEEFNKKVMSLSGGQKTRVSLGKLLLTKPDIILLDEPTNHLDMDSIEWLETFLSNYQGAVIIVAHDRYFLDKIVTKVISMENANVRVYSGNYSDFAVKREAIREALLKQYLNQQMEIKHQEEVIAKLKSFNREKSIKRAESREKTLAKIERVEKPEEINSAMNLQLEPNILSGNDVLTVTGLKKSFGSQYLFSDLNFEIKRGEHVALIGKNGTGKTTILKIINNITEADSGTVRLGSKVKIGYYDQEHMVLDMEKTAYDEIADSYPSLTGTKVRNTLAAFLFTNDDVFKKISDLSGGERGRISLAKLMLSEANFLILDEPTNHLDIESKEILENVLKNYTGTIFYVSHDRYFINATADRILDLSDNCLTNYVGNYDYYADKKIELNNISKDNLQIETDISKSSQNKADWKKNKEEQALLRKKENSIKKTEEKIEQIEEEIAKIENMLSDPKIGTDVAKLLEIQSKKECFEEELTGLLDEWENLMNSSAIISRKDE